MKTVFNSIKCTQSRIIESRVRKNFETPFYSFKVESFFNIFSGSRFLFFLVWNSARESEGSVFFRRNGRERERAREREREIEKKKEM